MNKPAVKDTWNFGSFVCVRRTPRIFLDEFHAAEPAVAGQPTIESPVAAPAATLNGHCHTADAGYLDADGSLHVLPISETQTTANKRCA